MLGQNTELERLLALPRNLQQEWGQRQEVTDHETSVGLKLMGTRGPSGSNQSSRLCRCAVLVPSPPQGHQSLMETTGSGLWGYVGTCQG